MPLDSLLLEILADPNDKQPLLWFEDDGLLYNPRRKEAYTVTDGIPVLLPSEARTLTEVEHSALMAKSETAVETGRTSSN
jgi:uncharacterized protein YbaR (Trm112 family)